MKKFLIPGILLLTLFISLVGGIFWWKWNSRPISDDKTPIRIVIPRGRSAAQVAQELYRKGLIRSPLVFKFYVQLTGKAKNIQAGEFQLSPNLSIPEILEMFSKGPLQLWVTVPEGLRREEIVGRFIEGLEMQGIQAETFGQEFLESSEGKEGFLFPDTYLFPRNATASAVIKVMNQTFEKKIDEDLRGAIAKSDFTLEEIITLASIIERETKTSEERPIVAGIFMNRIDIGMGLQADATVQYAVASAKCLMPSACNNWWPILTKEDLQIDSPYNTYKFKGLPPLPIANPGLSSIKAAIYPEDSDYFYYLHDPDGKIHYAKTLSEHNENVRKYLGK
ncbi:MAG: Aminodeoxychorismate lyase [Candidatus Woesebacteria bacterium GW2011_GWB1_39_10b]|uniref:Endolytic murein transglycosylase n=2 Tax=Candidatus Woeseibacteriota TaxID=1752722 RepID=A0A0G0NFU3_9BACT|nr:MAG: Aminodeoxychorismate lyase [Candidatus Woesebacteria bacterium GW2011_GWB1_39_10b]KKR14373.1 MAG: Aminodeoxychorismate lyase [Candidatus Woesebacteria bacterium GW2011_GWA1_39_21b]